MLAEQLRDDVAELVRVLCLLRRVERARGVHTPRLVVMCAVAGAVGRRAQCGELQARGADALVFGPLAAQHARVVGDVDRLRRAVDGDELDELREPPEQRPLRVFNSPLDAGDVAERDASAGEVKQGVRRRDFGSISGAEAWKPAGQLFAAKRLRAGFAGGQRDASGS